MIWNDTYLSQRPGIPKWLCCIASCINFVMAYFTIDSAMTETGLMNKTIPTLLSFF